MTRPTRTYSRAFTPRPGTKRRRIIIDKVPADLHEAVKAKAKREGASVRALVLTYLSEWAAVTGSINQEAAERIKAAWDRS